MFYNVPEYSTILKWTTMFLLELVLKKIHRDSFEFKLCKNIRLFIRMKRNIRIEYSFSYRYDPNKSNCVFLLVSNEYDNSFSRIKNTNLNKIHLFLFCVDRYELVIGSIQGPLFVKLERVGSEAAIPVTYWSGLNVLVFIIYY